METENARQTAGEASQVVRAFVESLARGRMVEALDLMAMDAVLRDETGHETRGIRGIAAALLPYRRPQSIALDRLESRGRDVLAVLRHRRARPFRGVFSVERGRIHAVRFEPM